MCEIIFRTLFVTETRQILRYRATAILRRLQIKLYSGWLKFRGVPIFVVFMEGPIHEFKYPRNFNFLYELLNKILWPRILNPTNVLFLFNPRKLVPTKIKPSTVYCLKIFIFTHGISYITNQNRESIEGYSMWKVEKRYGKFGRNALNNWSISKSPKGVRNQVSGRLSVPCWLATPVANAPWKPLVIQWCQARYQGHESGWLSDRLVIELVIFINESVISSQFQKRRKTDLQRKYDSKFENSE